MVSFRILGPLSVTVSEQEVPITAGRDRVVLAILLLAPGRVVGVEELIDAVWEDRPPATARGQLQTCVSRLRRAFGPDMIRTDPAGYAIRCAPDQLDAAVFTRLVARARSLAVPDPELSRKVFREALALWRGPVLAGLDGPAVRQRAAVLDEQHVSAIEDRVDLEPAGGHDPELLAELLGLVDRFPLRERLRAQLMRALQGAARQADALAEYRRFRALLRAELGIEPGEALQGLHRRILVGEPDRPQPPPSAGMIDNLPRAVGDFTGRAELMARLSGAPPGPGIPAIRVIDGMAGSGKTTSAVHLAGLVRERFPDARLFVDLLGHSDQRPLDPAAALVTLLRQLGVPAAGHPPGRCPAGPSASLAGGRPAAAVG